MFTLYCIHQFFACIQQFKLNWCEYVKDNFTLTTSQCLCYYRSLLTIGHEAQLGKKKTGSK